MSGRTLGQFRPTVQQRKSIYQYTNQRHGRIVALFCTEQNAYSSRSGRETHCFLAKIIFNIRE
jgi:hypothetical protein